MKKAIPPWLLSVCWGQTPHEIGQDLIRAAEAQFDVVWYPRRGNFKTQDQISIHKIIKGFCKYPSRPPKVKRRES